jgi:predicted type IV restriction endonuclease
MPKVSAPEIVRGLIARFDRNRDSYLAGGINEMQLRREFIDPFFSCLGWDIENKQGYAPAYREVIFEDSLRVGAETKAPDYCFRIGGMRKFFVEAKKPAVNIATDVAPAFQLRRYAWSAKLPLSILTDFEEFAVYDCRVRPTKTDKPSIGRIKFLEFKDYPDRWTELYETFSRDAVVKGSFDKFVEENRAKKGTTEVDDAFLSEIERWRDLLARNIALRNPRLTTRDLNFAVQRAIDRIIFLRICEDRAIETYGQLQALLNGERVYPRLKEVFHRADERYNSGLFHFRPEKNRPEGPDELSLKLLIDDKVLKDIISNLYYPDSPYEFSVFPPEILGQVYEQFLGKVIRLTAGHQAKVEDKPEVRKAGGVYYTPTYIVDYIVKNTVGKLVEGKAPSKISSLRVLDPACGSGSFLLGAFQYLLNWHRDWYVKDGPEKHTKELFPAQGGDWRLTTAKKKEILLNNIHGVDIDQQAVEVTKLSLLLKVLEGENEQTIQSQLKLFQERALPDLGNNIKCGNSLIGSDFYQGQQASLFDDVEERLRINTFDWEEKLGFRDIMKSGGFDAVIGNPPYVLGRETFDDEEKNYLSTRYRAFKGKYDLYVYFAERAVALLDQGGRLGFILPNTLLSNVNATELRRLLLDSTAIQSLRTFESRVFEKAQVESVVLITRKGGVPKDHKVVVEGQKTTQIPQQTYRDAPDCRFNVNVDSESDTIIQHVIRDSVPMGAITDMCIGIQLGGSSGTDSKHDFLTSSRKDDSCKRVLDGRDIGRYSLVWPGVYVRYGDWLHRKRDARYFLNDKIVIRQIGSTPVATVDDQKYYALNTLYNVIATGDYSLKYILGIVNSSVGRWFWTKRNSDFKTLFPKIKKAQLEAIPIRTVTFSDESERARHNKMVLLVERMLKLHKYLPKARTAPDKTAIERQIAAMDSQINKVAYELYGLSDDEIRIVEGTA